MCSRTSETSLCSFRVLCCVCCTRWAVTIRLFLAELTLPVYRVHSHHVSLYIKYRAVWLYPFAHSSNANLQCLHMIIHSRSEVGSVSQSLFIFAIYIKGFTCRCQAAFPCSLVLMLCLPLEFVCYFWCAYHTCLYEFYSAVNLFGFKYHYDMVLPKQHCGTTARNLRGFCVWNHLPREQSQVHRKETGQI